MKGAHTGLRDSSFKIEPEFGGKTYVVPKTGHSTDFSGHMAVPIHCVAGPEGLHIQRVEADRGFRAGFSLATPRRPGIGYSILLRESATSGCADSEFSVRGGGIMHDPMKVFLTGGTGFLGEYLLAELLDRGHTVWALYRNESRKLDTLRFLGSRNLPRSADSLHWCRGDILDTDRRWDTWCRECESLEEVDTLLHSAASTRLHLDEFGEPIKTNLGSAQALRNLVERKPMKVHMISTAYVCGLVQGETVFEVNHPRGDFVNVYEESKWEAEQIWNGEATLLRPSIIVGDSDTGRCTSFSGWYILVQAAHLMDRLMRETPLSDRLNLNLNIPADPKGTTNLIPVDYVAEAAVRLIENPAHHRKIFHLTHPAPPRHDWSLDFVSRRFNLGGLNFAGPGAPFTQPRNQIERMVWRQMQTILFHFANNPVFDRTNIDASGIDVEVPPISEDYLNKLIDYAIEQDWGASGH